MTKQKLPECREGLEAKENFERTMRVLFRAPKVLSKKKKQQDKPTASKRKPKSSDKG